jgi:hypothetical protein
MRTDKPCRLLIRFVTAFELLAEVIQGQKRSQSRCQLLCV